TVNTSGLTGGGQIIVGGDQRGQGSTPTATQTFIDGSSVLLANALEQGDGGKVIVWADDTTTFLGTIQAQGGLYGGNGGFVEVSGKENLIFRGDVSTFAPNGQMGTLLLDPQNIVIVNGTGAVDDNQLNAGVPGGGAGQILANDGGNTTLTIYEQKLELLGATTNVVLEANNDITINNLLDDRLNFASLFSGGLGTIKFVADADANGSGTFRMLDPNDSIVAPGRDLTISGASIIAGNLNTRKYAFGFGDGGDVILTATTGGVTAGNIDTRTQPTSLLGTTLGDAGNIIITAQAGITTGNLTPLSFQDGLGNTGQAGNITLTATTGTIATGALQLSSSTLNGEDADVGGDLIINALAGNIVVSGNIETISKSGTIPGNNANNGGLVDLDAQGSITIVGNIDTFSRGENAGTAGEVTINAGNGLTVGNLDTASQGNTGRSAPGSLTTTGGNLTTGNISTLTEENAEDGKAITLTASAGSITTGNLDSSSTSNVDANSGGPITLNAVTGITTGTIDSSAQGDDTADNAGAITLTTTTGNIITSDLDARSRSTTNRSQFGGAITVSTGGGNISTGAINSSSIGATNADNGGILTLTTSSGDITTGDLDTRSQAATGESKLGGNITATTSSGDITTGIVNTSSIAQKGPDDGGTVSLSTTLGSITTEAISTQSQSIENSAKNGGGINLSTNTGDITTGDLDTQSQSTNNDSAFGGAISVTTGGGSIQSGNLTTRSQANIINRNSQDAGNIVLTATVNTTVGNIDATSQGEKATIAGSVTLSAGNVLEAGVVNATAQGTDGINAAIDLTGNDVNFTGGDNSLLGSSVTLQTVDPSRNINLGIATDSDPTALNLTIADLGALDTSINPLILGNATSTGTIALFSAITDTGSNPLAVPVIIEGGSTLVGVDQNATWNITGANQGNLNGLFSNGLSFSNIENLVGGSGNDIFVFSNNAASLSGTVIGGAGIDRLDYSSQTIVTNANLSLLNGQGIEEVIGGTNLSNTLTGSNIANTWNITNLNAGTINGAVFGNFPNLIGGSLTDDFILSGTGNVTSINGGLGTNTLQGKNTVNTWNITSATTGSVSGVGSFSNIQGLVGGNNSDTFNFA
ncbi:MAG: beta strand repeat-containing protein, partial [Prochlorotrichaceae cyanobacterium]